MLFFICIIMLFLMLMLLIVISELKLEVNNLNVSSMSSDMIQDGYLVTIGLYIKKLPLIKFKFNKEKIVNVKLKEKIKKIDLQKYMKVMKPSKEVLQRIKFWKIDLEQINLNIAIDTIDPILTSYVTALISSIIGILFGIFIKNYDCKKQKFLVEPVYINKNLINLSLSCIISVKIWNIIKESLNHRKLYFDNMKNTKAVEI